MVHLEAIYANSI